MKRTEFRKIRSSKEARDHTCWCEDKFKSTHEWAFREKGQIVLASEGLNSYEEKAMRGFKHYFDLEPVCVDREMARPLCASDDMDEEIELDTNINNVLSNNKNDVSSEELIHSADECLKSNSMRVPTLLDVPIDATIDAPAQLKDYATHATPTKKCNKQK